MFRERKDEEGMEPTEAQRGSTKAAGPGRAAELGAAALRQGKDHRSACGFRDVLVIHVPDKSCWNSPGLKKTRSKEIKDRDYRIFKKNVCCEGET